MWCELNGVIGGADVNRESVQWTEDRCVVDTLNG